MAPSGPPGRRPPWWPDGEPFPPHGRPPWARRGRPRFMRRFGLYFVGFIMLVVGLATTTGWLVGNVLGMNRAAPPLRAASAAVLLGFLVAIGISGRLFRGLARPVSDLVEAAQKLEGGDLGARVAERGPRDVRSVARAFNSMSAALQESDQRRRQFLADVTHELRTPLSVIRGRAEGIVDGVYPGDAAHVAPVLDAARTLEALIDDLRTLALAEAGGLTLNREPVDLAVLVSETLARFADDARLRGVDLLATGPDQAPVLADPARLHSVLSNLLANAIHHAPAGTSVTVTARDVEDGVEVAVVDEGPGIPAELLPRVFARFVKDPGSSGSGLGMAIARDIVVAHGGHISASNRPGGGAQITLWIPSQQEL